MRSSLLPQAYGTFGSPDLIREQLYSLTDPKLANKLDTKGIKKYITYEVDEKTLKEKYGNHYDVVMGDLHQTDDLRVLDYDGHHVFYSFSLEELGKPIYHDA